MNFTQFQMSLNNDVAPENLSLYLSSLWYDAKGNWHKAHTTIQDIEDKNGAWIHAYLHRKEGDISNADYWYARAGRKRPGCSLRDEWEQIAKEFVE